MEEFLKIGTEAFLFKVKYLQLILLSSIQVHKILGIFLLSIGFMLDISSWRLQGDLFYIVLTSLASIRSDCSFCVPFQEEAIHSPCVCT